MDQDKISSIRKGLLASNPELSKAQVSDGVIEAVVEKVAQKNVRNTAERNEAGSADTITRAAIPGTEAVIAPISSESIPNKPVQKDIMNAVLEDLQGDGKNARTDNPNLASYVDQVLDLSKKE